MRRESNKIRILDTTCRDGMHAMAHHFTPEQIKALAEGAEAAGVDIFEVSHGDGLGGESITIMVSAQLPTKNGFLPRFQAKQHQAVCFNDTRYRDNVLRITNIFM